MESKSKGKMDNVIKLVLDKQFLMNRDLIVTTKCNLDCIYCWRHYFPSEGRNHKKLYDVPLKDIKSRINTMYPSRTAYIRINKSSLIIPEGEFFRYPYIWELLDFIRKRFSQTVNITTNGSLLTKKTLGKLQLYEPINLQISLNSANPKNLTKITRRSLEEAKTTIESVKISQRCRGISTLGTMVAIPNLVGWPDIERTAEYLQTFCDE